MGLVHTDVGESEYNYWSQSLQSFPMEQLHQGLKKAEDWQGFLTLGDFRKLCEKPVSVPYHKEYKALPIKSMEKEKLRENLAKMRKKLGL